MQHNIDVHYYIQEHRCMGLLICTVEIEIFKGFSYIS